MPEPPPCTHLGEIHPDVPPTGEGCVDCLAGDGPGWWLHLRRCATCGHVGCCDSSPSRHGTAHAQATGHSIVQSFEPGEDWYWCYRDQVAFAGPVLAEPSSRPLSQEPPAPRHQVPEDWRPPSS